MKYQEEIVTPVEGHKVIIRTMLTGAQQEEVESAQAPYLETEDGQNFKVSDMKKVMTAQKHELLRQSVVSINGDETNCFDRLRKMFDPDYQFVIQAIEDAQKKASGPTSEPSQ